MPEKDVETQLNPALVQAFLVPFETKEQLRNWVLTYLDIDLPDGHIDPESNSSPVEWLFTAYSTYRANTGETPGYIVLSSRASYKTLSEAIFSVIMLLHFKAEICHMAAIESQSDVAIGYITGFINKIRGYAEASGIKIDSQSKRRIEIVDSSGKPAYVKVIVCTLTGSNSSHSNIMCYDEVDVVRDVRAYHESAMIPNLTNGQFPLVIRTSTRKFANSLMQQAIDNIPTSKEVLLRWNILDITEHCPSSRCRPDLPKKNVYISKELPLKTLSAKEFAATTEKEKALYELFKAMSGCVSCRLLPVCQGRLHARPTDCVGGLYNKIEFTIGQFDKVSPDMGTAQLLCRRPSTSGLVYPRFASVDDSEDSNTYSIRHAYEILTGDFFPEAKLEDLVEKMKDLGIQFHGFGDWGYRHNFVVAVGAIVPSGEWWIVDAQVIAGLEFEQMIGIAESLRDVYQPKKWFMDPAMPMFLKAFTKRGMRCVKFKKDILGGVEAVRGQIVDGSGRRRLKIIRHERTEHPILALSNHAFKLDAQANPTTEVSDDFYADFADSTRYAAQNLFKPKGKVQSPSLPQPTQKQQPGLLAPNPNQFQNYGDWLTNKINEVTGNSMCKGGDAGSFYWDFSGDGNGE